MTYSLVTTTKITDKPHVTAEEARLIWANAPNNETRLLLRLLWFTGLRITEAVTLTPNDIVRDGFDFSVMVKTEKQKKEQKPDKLPLPRELGLDIYDYLKSQEIPNKARIFPKNRSTYWRHIQSSAKRADLPNWRDFHPHSFRHGFVYDKVNKGIHPFTLSKLARHRDLRTTLGYYTPTDNDLRQAIEK